MIQHSERDLHWWSSSMGWSPILVRHFHGQVTSMGVTPLWVWHLYGCDTSMGESPLLHRKGTSMVELPPWKRHLHGRSTTMWESPPWDCYFHWCDNYMEKHHYGRVTFMGEASPWERHLLFFLSAEGDTGGNFFRKGFYHSLYHRVPKHWVTGSSFGIAPAVSLHFGTLSFLLHLGLLVQSLFMLCVALSVVLLLGVLGVFPLVAMFPS